MKETEEQRYDKLRIRAWNLSLHSFGLAYIFDNKAGKFSYLTNLLKVFGIVVPVTVGATAMGYGFDSSILKMAIALAVPLTIVQLIISVLAVVNKWDEELAYSYEASQDLSLLSNNYRKLAELPPNDFKKFDEEMELLNVRFHSRSQQNSKHHIEEWELRKGMRYSLREFKRKCAGCQEIPVSMNASDCDICGKFRTKKKLY